MPTTQGELKRLAAGYYRQLTKGCGSDGCQNTFCASSKRAPPVADASPRRRAPPFPHATASVVSVHLAVEHADAHLCGGSAGQGSSAASSAASASAASASEEPDALPVPPASMAAAATSFAWKVLSASPFAFLYAAGAHAPPPASGATRASAGEHASSGSPDGPVASRASGSTPTPPPPPLLGAGIHADHAPSKSAALAAIEALFGSPDALIEAFRKAPSPEEDARTGEFVDTRFLAALPDSTEGASLLSQLIELQPRMPHCDLNRAAVKQGYASVLSSDPSLATRAALATTIAKSLARLQTTPPALQDAGVLPLFLLVVCELPGLEQGKGAVGHSNRINALLHAMCAAISAMKLGSQLLFVHWVSELPGADIARLVTIFQRLLSEQSTSFVVLKGPIYQTVRTLQLLHDANEAGGKALQLEHFYNEELCSGLVFKDEYQTWQKRLEEPSSMPASALEFPFLLGPAYKARVLRIDAMVQMSKTFQDAFVNQAWVRHAHKLRDDTKAPEQVGPVLREAINPYVGKPNRGQNSHPALVCLAPPP